jgi:hypothetical protein
MLISLDIFSSLYHATHLALFRPLQEFEDVQLPIEVGSPRELCFQHAAESMEMIWTYRRAFSLQHTSCVGLLSPYMVVLTLSPQLRDGPQKIEPFVRACKALVEYAESFPVAPYILAMLKALDVEHDFGFPEEAKLILQESYLPPQELGDIPMELQIPVPHRPRHRASVLRPPGSVNSESVGDLLARWAGVSNGEPQ